MHSLFTDCEAPSNHAAQPWDPRGQVAGRQRATASSTPTRPTTSSSAPAPPAASWPTACRPVAPQCCCLRRVATRRSTARSGTGSSHACRPRSHCPCAIPSRTGATWPSPSRRWRAGASHAHVAKGWAARRRSTAWCTCAAIRACSWEVDGGAPPTCCRTFGGWSACASVARRPRRPDVSGCAGADEPLRVAHGVNALGTPLYDAFVKAGGEAGYGSLGDYNGTRQEGLSACR